MSEDETGVVPRLMVFPDRPDCLVLYLPRGMTVEMPSITSPFVKADIASACAKARLDTRVSEGTPGKWGAAYKSLHKAEQSERGSRTYLATAARNAERKASGSAAAKTRAEAIERWQKVNEELRALKAEIGTVKSRAFTRGEYLPVEVYRAKEKRLRDLRDEGQALQVRIGELRKQEKQEFAAEDRCFAEAFLKVAEEVLPEETLQRLYGMLQKDWDNVEGLEGVT